MDKSIHGHRLEQLTGILREARLERELRQRDVADRLDAPQSFVSKYETGERRLDLVELEAVCDALRLPLSDLVERFLSVRGR